MPRDGAIVFSDLIGKLDVLNVACEKCGRAGRYRLDRLIQDRGRDAKLIKFYLNCCEVRAADVLASNIHAVRWTIA